LVSTRGTSCQLAHSVSKAGLLQANNSPLHGPRTGDPKGTCRSPASPGRMKQATFPLTDNPHV
ncbi:MAG TPA: hypothetical protein VMR25_06050, partial [Planctomycetaceae bacterium]|nr:hypothetical protein [Planctomycetaceae bacterium]